MVDIGSGAKRETDDWFLSRYAAYLIAMNSDTSKPEVGAAQTYFTVQTRRQELQDQLTPVEQRGFARERLTLAKAWIKGQSPPELRKCRVCTL